MVEVPAAPASGGVQPALPQAGDTAETPPVEVGVLLTLRPGGLGEWLADAAAFDASGAHSLWIEAEPELDVLALAAALAAVTFRARLVVAPPDHGGVPAARARTLRTIARLSNGRLALIATDATDGTAADEEGTPEGAAESAVIFRRVAGEAGAFETADRNSGHGTGKEPRRWLTVPVPQGRAAWRDALAEAASGGAHGVLVPADPRLLDILRNPDDPGERHDLQIALG